MEMTVTLTAAEKEALKAAFPGVSEEEAVTLLFRSELERKCRIQLRRAKVVAFQGLKKPR